MEEMIIADTWRKSARCEASSCVEVATGGTAVGLRNSNQPETSLAIGTTAWRQFIEGVQVGEFDRPA